MPTVLHGIATDILIKEKDVLFDGLPERFKVCRYHSWAIEPTKSGEVQVTAVDDNDEIMAIKHPKYDVRGVQFHPESILTEHGIKMMDNWLKV
jgi:anthranilate synthase component 2